MESPPRQIGAYTIDREIGRGGMGVVYLGHDTRLDRPVAIKALPEHLAADPGRLARFEREARTLASLSHPNVAGIYGVEEHEGAKYLILEYVEGETLADRLDRGPLPIDEALEIASQIAAGVEAAHDQGVIHRDLKPGNIIVTPVGDAKVLDFGLARIEETSSSSVGGGLSASPTISSPAIQHSPTIPGAILGTAAYMSPEQARGRKVDKRTDIWSFGVVLYEMLIGASPFRGETVSDSIGAVLHKEIDLDCLPADTPPMVRHVLRRCLDRDKTKRYHDIGDAVLDLATPSQQDTPSTGSQKGVHPLLLSLVAIIFLALGAGAVMLLTTSPLPPAPPAPPVIRATISPPDDVVVVFTGDLAGPAVISRDGANVAFVAKRTGERQQLYLRELDSPDADPLRGTESAIFPFWSWDGLEIGYFAYGELRAYNLTTRTNRTVCAAQGGRGGAWLADDTIVFTPGFQSPIHRVPASGGQSTPVTTINNDRHTSHRWPSATPDGVGFIYIAVSHQDGKSDESAIFLATPGDSPDIEITRAQYGATIVGDQLLLVRDSILFATPINLVTGELIGEAKPIVSGVASDISTWNASFSAAASGALVFHEAAPDLLDDQLLGAASTFGEARRTKLIRRDGRVSNILADGVPQNSVSLSPDFEYLAISGFPRRQSARASYDIWLYRLPAKNLGEATDEDNVSGQSSAVTQSRLSEPPRRLTFLDGAELSPRWSPDSQWLVFATAGLSDQSTVHGLYKIRASGGQPELILESPDGENSVLLPWDWSSDGRYIIYSEGAWVGIGVNDIYALDLQTNETFPLVTDDGDQGEGMISPDGKWLAYETNESGQLEVYVIPFQPGWEAERAQGLPTPSEQSRWRISIAGGGRPRWNSNGSELFYISTSNSMVAVKVGAEGVQFTSGVGAALFTAKIETGVDFDVSFDSKYFAINSAADETKTSINLLTNWQQLLNKK